MDIILNAPKRSLIRFATVAASTRTSSVIGPLMTSQPVLKSTVVKLVDGSGPCLEVKRNGVPMKAYHPSVTSWVKTLPPGAEKNLSVQYPPKSAVARMMA